jgi:hypothetical protein
MKGLDNPIDKMESAMNKIVKNKFDEEESSKNDLLTPSKDKFNNIFNQMNHMEEDEKHMDLHDTKAKMNVNHNIAEDQTRPTNYDVRKNRGGMGN